MVELSEKSPFDGLLPFSIGDVDVTEVKDLSLHLMAPSKSSMAGFVKAVKKDFKSDVPQPRQMISNSIGQTLTRFDHAHYLIMSGAPSAAMAKHCSVTEQTDGWAVLDVRGKNARFVLARLILMDLRSETFPVGSFARCEVAHMAGAIWRPDEDAYRIMVFRSMAGTLVHKLQVAMESVAALEESD